MTDAHNAGVPTAGAATRGSPESARRPRAAADDIRVLTTEGFVVVPDVLDDAACSRLSGMTPPAATGVGDSRRLLDEAWCADLARFLLERSNVSELIPKGHVAVQCTSFGKSAARNWTVALHQDLSIPVAERVDDPALRGWSTKEGVLFVQPPVEVLENLVAVRLHLDLCGVDDGPLRVVPRTHVFGRLDPEAIESARRRIPEVVCTAEIGDAIVLRPLLLHASSKATGNRTRRVLHLVFGPAELPFGLKWARFV